jgi:phosphatidylserine/phosphatidylglycerophosphate/cardiolipin synthase-like enzyme
MKEGKVREAVRERAGSRDYKAVKAAMEKMPVLRNLVTSLLKPEVLQPGEFYDRLARDMMEAEDDIIIYSPFTLRPRVMGVLAVIDRSKAQATIYTKPVEEFKGDQMKWQKVNIGEMEKAGVTVKTREKMHEKAVLIDDSVAYFGSLNVLSRWKEEESGDYMLRYEGPLVSSLIEDFLGTMNGNAEELPNQGE